ncbi:hypothetical protein CVT25_003854 [Psilocybe cyanescens]|uniref:Uncharacterized protein n=1 Tax=Psilocybe cyanescens TaxID=93625 RepID=A0A409WY42_PSICY|nr:hypothetical protein CVT25_003854 [Psilocybe cyanescens]
MGQTQIKNKEIHVQQASFGGAVVKDTDRSGAWFYGSRFEGALCRGREEELGVQAALNADP